MWIAVRPQRGQSNPQQAVRNAQTNAMAAVRAPQDEELMAQGKDSPFQSCSSSEAGWRGEKQGDEKGEHGSGSLHGAAP